MKNMDNDIRMLYTCYQMNDQKIQEESGYDRVSAGYL